jgi:hypothetical protein
MFVHPFGFQLRFTVQRSYGISDCATGDADNSTGGRSSDNGSSNHHRNY